MSSDLSSVPPSAVASDRLILTAALSNKAEKPDLGGFEDRIDWLFATLPQLDDDADVEAARTKNAAAK